MSTKPNKSKRQSDVANSTQPGKTRRPDKAAKRPGIWSPKPVQSDSTSTSSIVKSPGALLRYPGGKTRLAKLIVPEIFSQGNLSTAEYREPFIGGGSILHRVLPNARSIWINDVDADLAALHTSVMLYPDDLKERILAFEPSDEEFRRMKNELRFGAADLTYRDTLVERGFYKLAVHRMGRSGLGTKGGAMKNIASRWNPCKLCKTIDHLHNLFSKNSIRNHCCTSVDFEELILDDNRPAVLYLDPPYVAKGSKCYEHSFTERDHLRLADALKRTPHGWVLSYDNHPLVHELYGGWADIKEIAASYSAAGARMAMELLITPIGKGK
ncbi:MAG: DNA adenine methylase [Capsulimonadaceae bacterium]|nr:DNA adenine methylase [Capsulimonadaceae bacterium]